MKKIMKQGSRFSLKIYRLLIVLMILAALCVLAGLGVNYYVQKTTEEQIVTAEYDWQSFDADCILVLGCGVREDGTPTWMLEDRVLTAVELYKAGAAPKILMSGDHGRVSYDEVNVMKDLAMEKGVPSEDIFMDHAGFSTYESMYRAGAIFQAERAVVVTQEYHLYRSLYDAEKLGLEAVGVSADRRHYRKQIIREVREILARNKDFLILFWKPEPTYLGESIPVSGSGDVTND